MRTLIGFVAIACVVGMGCSSSSSAGGAGGGRSILSNDCSDQGTPQSCTGNDAYNQCRENACDAQLKAALGASYAIGDVSGSPCEQFVACQLACPCNSSVSTCESTCFANASAACQNLLVPLDNCVTAAACPLTGCTSTGAGGSTGFGGTPNTGGSTGFGGTSSTGGSTGLGGSTGGTYTCAQLSACCPTLSSTIQPSCTTVVGYGIQQACSGAYTSWCTGSTGTGGSIGTGGSTGSGGAVGTGGSTGATYTCAQLSACCPTLSSAYQSSCTALVTYAIETACSSTYTSLKSAGLCP